MGSSRHRRERPLPEGAYLEKLLMPTDQAQIERQLAEELGLSPKYVGKLSQVAEHKILWDALLSREIALRELRDKLLCNCDEPYFGAQIVGTPLKCERCGKEVGAEYKTIRQRAEAAESALREAREDIQYRLAQLNSYEALTKKIMQIVEAAFPDERYSDYDVLDQGVARLAREREQVRELLRRWIAVGLLLRCDADLKEGASKEACVKLGAIWRESEAVLSPSPKK